MRSFVLALLAVLIGAASPAQSQQQYQQQQSQDRYDRDGERNRGEGRDREGRDRPRGGSERGAAIRSHPDMNERCLDVAYGDREPGAFLHMWECWYGSNQQFIYDRGKEELRTVSGQCLEIFGGRIGDRIGTARCDNGDNQRWRVEERRGGRFYQFVGANNLCMDIAGADRRNGARLQAWRCHSGESQQWSIEQDR